MTLFVMFQYHFELIFLLYERQLSSGFALGIKFIACELVGIVYLCLVFLFQFLMSSQ